MFTKDEGNGSENDERFVVEMSPYFPPESLLYFPIASQVKSKFLIKAFSAFPGLAPISI